MQKYHADRSFKQIDGATVWYSKWWRMVARVDNCRLEDIEGDMRRTVYGTGEPNTYFSIPAVCRIAGVRVRGYLAADDDGNMVFRHTTRRRVPCLLKHGGRYTGEPW